MAVLEERGHFWWDDEPIPEGQIAPDSAITGLLKISDDGSIDLELEGVLPSDQSPLETFFERRIPPGRNIRGLLKRNNDYALLCELSLSGGRLSSRGVSYERYHGGKCLIGDSSVTGGAHLSHFKVMEIELKGFEEWLWLQSIAVTRTETEFSASYRKPDDHVFSVDGGTLTIHYALYSPWKSLSTHSVNVREAASIIYAANDCISLDTMAEFYGDLSDLFILFTGSNYNLEWPVLSPEAGDGECTFYFRRLAGDSAPPTPHDWWIR